MKKIFVLTGLIATAVVFYNCHGSKKAAATPKLTYNTNLKTVIETSCSPCHIAGKGNKKPFDNYANVKTDIDEMIRRIELKPEDKGFMPFKNPKLPDATIAIFKQWKADGSLENN
ncbi:MAG: hypothetical protein ACHQFX_04220 [Chitinophagales bacterium]